VQYKNLFKTLRFIIDLFCIFSTQSRYGPNGERFSYTLAMVFIQCVVNAIFAKLGTYLFFYDCAQVHYLNCLLLALSVLLEVTSVCLYMFNTETMLKLVEVCFAKCWNCEVCYCA